MARKKTVSAAEALEAIKKLEAQTAAKRAELEGQVALEVEQANAVPRIIERKEKAALSEKEIDLALQVAKWSLKKFGTVEPPKEALYAMMDAECPHCHRVKPIADGFGFKRRPSDGKLVPQSWCNDCRSGKDSHPTRNR